MSRELIPPDSCSVCNVFEGRGTVLNSLSMVFLLRDGPPIMWVPNPSPVLAKKDLLCVQRFDQQCWGWAPAAGVGAVWRESPRAFPESSSVLEEVICP